MNNVFILKIISTYLQNNNPIIEYSGSFLEKKKGSGTQVISYEFISKNSSKYMECNHLEIHTHLYSLYKSLLCALTLHSLMDLGFTQEL